MIHTPRIYMTDEQIAELIKVAVPYWHVCVRGPIPFGQNEPVRLSIDYLVRPTREDAVGVMWQIVHSACETWKREFDRDEWEIVHATMFNGN